MKVVLFCGGFGTRIRDYSQSTPKPLVPIGYRPILWNIMRYYAYYGHKEFILCLGYKSDLIKKYFIDYDETISNNFVFARSGSDIKMLNTDIDDWRITFVDTGMNSNIGMRLLAVKKFLEDDDIFLANYGDGLTDLPLNQMINEFLAQKNKIASFMLHDPKDSFHMVKRGKGGIVTSIGPLSNSGLFINAGYFIFRKGIFDYIKPGEELVNEPFQRLISKQKLISYVHPGFWKCMDTFKDKQKLDKAYAKGNPPWEVWNKK